MSPVLLAPVLVALLVLLLVVRRRRTAQPAPTAVPAVVAPAPAAAPEPLVEHVDAALPESEKVRLLRLQVSALTETLHAATGGTLEVDATPFAVVRTVRATAVAAAAEPDHPVHPVELAVEPEPEPVPVLDVRDTTADAYTDLSRARAAAGDLREAALAQWAADLRVLGPLLEGRTRELYDALTGLAPVDAASAVTAARAVAAGLLGPDVPLADLLADAGHLAAAPVVGAPAYTLDDVAHDVLPDRVVDALTTALLDSAARGDDPARVSVGLRCDLVAHAAHGASGRPGLDPAALVRGILEPHEQASYDVRLAG